MSDTSNLDPVEAIPGTERNRSMLFRRQPTEDLTYENTVTRARKTHSTRLLTNKSTSHAKHVLSEIFEYSLENKTSVKIVSGRLSEVCWSDLSKFVRQLHDAKIDLEAIICNADNNDLAGNNSFYDELVTYFEGTTYFLDKNSETEIDHFAISGNAFRLESSDQDTTAILGFNNPKIVNSLTRLFEVIKSSAVNR